MDLPVSERNLRERNGSERVHSTRSSVGEATEGRKEAPFVVRMLIRPTASRLRKLLLSFFGSALRTMYSSHSFRRTGNI